MEEGTVSLGDEADEFSYRSSESAVQSELRSFLIGSMSPVLDPDQMRCSSLMKKS